MASVANGCSPSCVSDRKWYHGIHWQDQKARQASFHKRRVYTCFKWACFLMRTKKNWEGCDRPICCFFKFKLASFLSDLQKHPSHITSRANLTSWPKWLIDCLSPLSHESCPRENKTFLSKSLCWSHGITETHWEHRVDLATVKKSLHDIQVRGKQRQHYVLLSCYLVLGFPQRSTRSMSWLGFSTIFCFSIWTSNSLFSFTDDLFLDIVLNFMWLTYSQSEAVSRVGCHNEHAFTQPPLARFPWCMSHVTVFSQSVWKVVTRSMKSSFLS